MHQFMPKNLFDLFQIVVSNQSWNEGVVKIECHKCFSMKYGHHQRANTLYIIDAPNNKRNTCSKIFLFSLPFISVKILSVKIQWKERDGVRLSSAVPKIQWDFNPQCPYDY